MVGVACTGKGLLSGVDPAWDSGCPPAPLGALQEAPRPQPANPDAPPRSSVSSSVRWGVCSTKAAPITGGPSPGCLPCLFLLILREAKEAQPAQTFRIPPRPNSPGRSERGPFCLDPAHQGGGRRARLWVHLSKECLPPVPLSSAGQARGERVHSGRPLRLQTCFDALGAKGAPK